MNSMMKFDSALEGHSGLFKVLKGFLMPPKGLLGVLVGLIEPLEGPMRFYLQSSEGPAMSLTA
jgi:hypothetical protein